MKPISLKIIKTNQFSKILEEEWIRCNSIEEIHDILQELKGNIEGIIVNYWIKEK